MACGSSVEVRLGVVVVSVPVPCGGMALASSSSTKFLCPPRSSKAPPCHDLLLFLLSFDQLVVVVAGLGTPQSVV